MTGHLCNRVAYARQDVAPARECVLNVSVCMKSDESCPCSLEAPNAVVLSGQYLHLAMMARLAPSKLQHTVHQIEAMVSAYIVTNLSVTSPACATRWWPRLNCHRNLGAYILPKLHSIKIAVPHKNVCRPTDDDLQAFAAALFVTSN
jgi:hypothetical protein